MLKKLTTISLVVTSVFGAHQVEVNVNQNDFEGKVRVELSRMGDTLNGSYAGVRILNGHADNSHTLTNPSPLIEGSFLIDRPVRAIQGLHVGLGIKAEYTSLNSSTYLAVPLGAEALWKLPLNFPLPVRMGASMYYAPPSLSFYSGYSYWENRLFVSTEIIDNGHLELGYRHINTDVGTKDLTYNDSAYVGMILEF